MYVPIEIGIFLYHLKKTLLILYYCVIVQEKLLYRFNRVVQVRQKNTVFVPY